MFGRWVLLSAVACAVVTARFLHKQQDSPAQKEANDKTDAKEEEVPTLSTISKSMDGVEERVHRLNQDLSGIQANITALETLTASGMQDLAKIGKAISDTEAQSKKNNIRATKLEQNAVEIEANLRNNTAKLGTLQNYLGKLGENINILGGAGADTAQKVAELEKAVNETVPTGTIAKNMEEIEGKVTTFEEKLAAGLRDQISAYVRTNIDDMRTQVRELGRKVNKD